MAYQERKRIAVLMGQPEEYAHERFLKGFLEEAFKLDYDVCVFAMFIKYQNTPARSIGESSIFKIVNYEKFDCIVVMADTIQTKGVAERIEKELHEGYSGKVLFVDQESEFFPSIHIDNYEPEKAVITHLIEKHGYRDIAFLTGKSWHPHSRIRLQAYRDALTEHGIEVRDDRIFYGDFWYTSGESLADTLASQGGKLPEAIAFANDCMALGFAKGITSNGYRIPEDIAIAGFDSNEEGKHAPVPLTSVPMSSVQLGHNAMLMADALIKGEEPRKVSMPPEMFIGGTCGCGCDSAVPVYYKRNAWDTEQSLATMFSPFNHMEDDMISQTTFTGLISTIFGCMHLIRGFDSFSLCLNPTLGEYGDEFENKIMQAIKCESEDKKNDRFTTDIYFSRERMLPELYDRRAKPAVFYFMPLYYDESVFGYSVVRFDGRAEGISPGYRAWLRSVCRGIESYRRSDAIIGSSKIAKQGIFTDTLTGLPNYKGFIDNAETFMHLIHNNGSHVGVLAVDVRGLSDINDTYGRKEGDKVLVTVASAMENVFSSRNCMCFRAGNDELVALRITRSPDDNEMLYEKDRLMARVAELSKGSESPYDIELYYGVICGSPETAEKLERLVNVAISRKNSNKAAAQKLSEGALSEEEEKVARIVREILDDNKITYHFQPIVDAKTGRIYAYEALMRVEVTPYLPPPVILRYAEFYDRLYDVEKATFSGVLSEMRSHEGALADGRKIFINSIPGLMLKDDDLDMLVEFASSHRDSIVVELTEHSEMTDEDLKHMKQTYDSLGIGTAVDDYGTGYSNVSNLLRYLPDYVKIDRALISGIEDSPQKQHFVRDIIEFSHNNGIKALAEGVETREELETVIMLGADLIQGYYTGRPEREMIQSISSLVVDEIKKLSHIRESSNS